MEASIREFIVKTKEHYQQYLQNRSASEVLMGKPLEVHWNAEFKKAGYYCVEYLMTAIKNEDRWTETHLWCQEHFGKDHYSWTGHHFWFESERDAVLFALKWS